MMLLVIAAIILAAGQAVLTEDCVHRDYGNDGTVCVCDKNHCDELKFIEKLEETKYVKVTSNNAGLRFQQEVGNFSEISSTEPQNLIEIGTETYQEIIGFGGAFTDSTGINIKSLSEDLQDKIMRAYFSDEGLEYNIGRVPIGGTDFSTHPYSYCDTENNTADPDLVNFKLAPEDYDLKIPFIQKALELRNNQINLFASSWIAPNWMKTKQNFTDKWSFLKPEMYQPWADYFIKFLDNYKENNISFWGITTGNEPLTAFTTKEIPSVAWTPPEMIKWIKENLGPTIRNSPYSELKILGLDDQRILLPWMIELLFSDEDVKNYVDGIGVHWYMDFFVSPKALDDTHNKYPNKFILSTESCNGFLFLHVLLGNWDRAQVYADHIIQDLNHWVTGWTDWNMVLDLQGGPTFINNFVDAPIIINATAQEFYKQPTYYALGHFSKFLPKGSYRLNYTASNDFTVTAFKRPDEGTAVIILNKKFKDVSITVRDPKRGDININLTSRSITSIVYW